MALVTRVSRLLQADFHAVLDRIEEPDVLLRQAVREMQEELARDEQRSKLMQHEQGQIGARMRELEQSLRETEAQLDVCLDSGNDELARNCVRRKLEAQRFCKSLARKRQALQEALGQLDARISENRSRLESMQQKAELLAGDSAREQPADSWSLAEFSVREEEVDVALLHEKQRRRLS
jgi:phage shock protein A